MRIPNSSVLMTTLAAIAGGALPALGQTAVPTSKTLSGSASLVADSVGPDIGQFLRIRTPSAPQLAPDGTVYLRDWPDGIFQLYRRDAGDAPGATGEKLTSFADGISGFSVGPDGSSVIIEAGVGGSEQDDLFLLDPKSGEIRTLKSDPGVVYSAQAWAPDGSAFIFSANDASPSDFHLYRYDLSNGRVDGVLSRAG
jgi:hypothetical protein